MSSAKQSRIEYLDGLRGWGAVVVFFFHLVYMFLADAEPALAPIWLNFLLDGPFAVLVFFVISGFALSHANLQPLSRDLQLAATARYFRLAIPILVTTFLGYCLLKAGLIVNLEVAAQTGVSPRWLGTFYDFEPSVYGSVKFALYNAFFQYYPEFSYNSSLWTIPVEFAGSLAIYAYLALFRTGDRVHWFVSVAALAVSLKIAPYIGCFFGGYLIAEAAKAFDRGRDHSRGSQWGWVIGICAAASFYCVALVVTFFRPDEKGNLALLCVLAIILVASVTFSNLLRKAFSCRLSRFLGRISFPLYLCHIFVICSWSSYLFIWLPTLGWSAEWANTINIATSFVITLLVSVLLLPIERFSVGMSKRVARVILGRTGSGDRFQHHPVEDGNGGGQSSAGKI